MLCPGCAVPLQNEQRCPRCAGLWTSLPRLEELYAKGIPQDLLQPAELEMSLAAYGRERPCPQCRFPLRAAEYRVSSIERCPICEGVWIERVMLLKLTLNW